MQPPDRVCFMCGVAHFGKCEAFRKEKLRPPRPVGDEFKSREVRALPEMKAATSPPLVRSKLIVLEAEIEALQAEVKSLKRKLAAKIVDTTAKRANVHGTSSRDVHGTDVHGTECPTCKARRDAERLKKAKYRKGTKPKYQGLHE